MTLVIVGRCLIIQSERKGAMGPGWHRLAKPSSSILFQNFFAEHRINRLGISLLHL
jgi:hypothetical protein